MIGRTIAHYRIIEKLGTGGMGEVYLAEDLRLGRTITLKLLSSSLLSDDEQKDRLEREARAASSLNHPNILVIYEIGEWEDVYFMAAEYVAGKTLRSRLERGPIAMPEAVDIALQVMAALQAAHTAGIVHRDIKPENIMIRPDGFVKVLDFGLARMTKAPEMDSESARTMFQTQPGMLVGTLPYMSPEQARGLPVDATTDLFSAGVVLYEMLTGKRPFDGVTPADTLVQILEKEPPLPEHLPADANGAIQEILAKALSKDVKDRYQTAGEFLAELKRVKQRLEFESELQRAGGLRPLTMLPRLVQLTFASEVEEYPDWSPDDNQLVFSREVSGLRKIFMKQLDSGSERQVTTGNGDEIQPAWAPDGDYILFVRGRKAGSRLEPWDVFGGHDGGDIWKLDVQTGKQSRLIENAFNPAVSRDGQKIAFDASWAGPRRIWMSDRHGRNPQQVSSDTSEAMVHIRPRWSPDGSRIVFQNIERTKFDVRVIDLATRNLHWVTDDQIQDLNPAWSPSGKFIYFTSYRSGGLNIWRMPVSPEGHAVGPPQQLTAGAGQDVELAISKTGKGLAFSILKQNADIWRLPVDPQTGTPTGDPQALIDTTREDSRGAWSPDGSMIAFNSDRTGEMNIWLYSLEDGATRQITTGPGGDYQPSWSPDAKWITFFSSRAGTPDIWAVHCETGELLQLTKNDRININPFYSPDGKLIAYQSDESGRPEIWVMNSDGTKARQKTSIGTRGHFLRWGQDGTSVLFFSPTAERPGLHRIRMDSEEPEPLVALQGGAHISFNPDYSLVMDVVAHKTLWTSPLHGGSPQQVFEFKNPSARIDYPVWSPDGRWILFDLFKPQGGDIWIMKDFE